MHDLDRIREEYESGVTGLDSEDVSLALEAMFSAENQEYESDSEAEGGQYGDSEQEAVLDEADEMELAAELLEVHGDEELEQFLGKLIRRVGSKVGKFIKSPTGQALTGLLKGAVTTALPGVAGLSGAVSGLTKALGPQAAQTASSLLGMELEGLSPEDQEFESARQLIRLGTSAARRAAYAPWGNPASIANSAFRAAAQRYAPGYIRRPQGLGGGHQQSGRWYRQGQRIILEGV